MYWLNAFFIYCISFCACCKQNFDHFDTIVLDGNVNWI
jgi:hypothetical protein